MSPQHRDGTEMTVEGIKSLGREQLNRAIVGAGVWTRWCGDTVNYARQLENCLTGRDG